MGSISFGTLQELANSVGLAVVGVASSEILTKDQEHLRCWQEAGYAGEMAFMRRDPELLSAPQRVVPEARSVVVIGAFYDRGTREPLPYGHGRVARYAWGRDYHKVLNARLRMLCQRVEQHLTMPLQYRVFADAVPLLERALAREAGLGFIGKNSMLIVPRAGSFLFLGEVLWNIDVIDLPSASLPEGDVSVSPGHGKSHCGSCSRCLNSCPTSAFVGERLLDARRCISYLTIEKRGYLTWQERQWLGEWVFGCDVCQDVCPFNVISITTRAKPDLEEFSPSYGVGQTLNLAELLTIRTDREFVGRFGGTPLMRTKREGLLRNAAVVLGNMKVVGAEEVLAAAVREDPSPVVRAHALWGLASLSTAAGSVVISDVKNLLTVCARDVDMTVRAEASLIAQQLV
jgi:epoxyqueuosine reductase